jgi:glycosyltransferase involved in cell wall biosynthesis
MVVERFPPDVGGSGIRFREIAQRLSRKHAVDIFTLGCRAAEDSTLGFCVYRCDPSKLPDLNSYGLNRIAGLSFSTFLQFLFRSYEIIDVDIWPIFPFFSARIARPGTPTIISWNVVWPFSVRQVASSASTFLAMRCSKLCTYNITVSNFARRMLIEHLNVNPEKLSVIPNGNEEAFLRARLKPKQGRIIFVGRLELQKRLDLVLEAFKIFKESVNDAELHIVGSGPLSSELIHKSDKIDDVHLHMHIPAQNRNELVTLLSNSWVFVSASEFETYGLAVSEASTVGLPVVITRTAYNAAVDETIKNNINGLIVDHNRPKAIADAFERLYRNPELWKNLSDNAKRLAIFHSWDEVANQVEAVYKGVLTGRLPIDKSGVASA